MKHNLLIITLLCINVIELKAQADVEKRDYSEKCVRGKKTTFAK